MDVTCSTVKLIPPSGDPATIFSHNWFLFSRYDISLDALVNRYSGFGFSALFFVAILLFCQRFLNAYTRAVYEFCFVYSTSTRVPAWIPGRDERKTNRPIHYYVCNNAKCYDVEERRTKKVAIH